MGGYFARCVSDDGRWRLSSDRFSWIMAICWCERLKWVVLVQAEKQAQSVHIQSSPSTRPGEQSESRPMMPHADLRQVAGRQVHAATNSLMRSSPTVGVRYATTCAPSETSRLRSVAYRVESVSSTPNSCSPPTYSEVLADLPIHQGITAETVRSRSGRWRSPAAPRWGGRRWRAGSDTDELFKVRAGQVVTGGRQGGGGEKAGSRRAWNREDRIDALERRACPAVRLRAAIGGDSRI